MPKFRPSLISRRRVTHPCIIALMLHDVAPSHRWNRPIEVLLRHYTLAGRNTARFSSANLARMGHACVPLPAASGESRGGEIRTRDLSHPKRALYQAEPRPDTPYSQDIFILSVSSRRQQSQVCNRWLLGYGTMARRFCQLHTGTQQLHYGCFGSSFTSQASGRLQGSRQAAVLR